MAIDVEQCYRKYGPMVLRRCRFLLRNEERALDAMQEVFVKVLQRQEQLEGTYPSSLLFRIATNVCLNALRKNSRNPELVHDEMLMRIASHEDIEKRTIAADFLDRIFQREQQSTREIAVMHYVDGMTLREVSDEVGLSVSGVRKRLRTLRQKVKAMEEV
jgi:RNA polymerase sigma factor (sigma-70 family)